VGGGGHPVTHDPSAIATWANVVTVTRVMVSPVLFALITGSEGSWVALALWVALCASDAVDGYLARRYGTTRSGAFLDPLADKVLVLGAMFTLVGRGVFPVLPVAIIAVREVIISLYRTFAGAKGVSIPATPVAKLKTVFQQLAVGFALFPPTAVDGERLWLTLLWIAVVLTVVSGAHYLLRARRVATERVPVPQSAAG
jgi:CDP-diacylglycerol---glycerol-3-phosphate 3-phosphatidyltransferase